MLFHDRFCELNCHGLRSGGVTAFTATARLAGPHSSLFGTSANGFHGVDRVVDRDFFVVHAEVCVTITNRQFKCGRPHGQTIDNVKLRKPAVSRANLETMLTV